MRQLKNFFKNLVKAMSLSAKAIGVAGLLPPLIAALGALAALKISSSLNADQILKNPQFNIDAALSATILVFVSTIFAFTLKYLNNSRSNTKDYDDVLRRARKSLEYQRIRYGREASASGNLTNEDQEKIRAHIEDSIKNITESSIVDQMKESLKSADLFERSSLYFNSSIKRITLEINSLQSRAALNLTIGIVATMVGIFALAMFVFLANYQSFSINQFIFHFFPRLSLVLFIQVFAFFFLKIYKSNMDEIKYFHNELTGIEARISAVSMALSLDDKECSSKLISELSTVDRNKATDRGEKIDIDKSTENLTKLLGAIAPLIKK